MHSGLLNNAKFSTGLINSDESGPSGATLETQISTLINPTQRALTKNSSDGTLSEP